MPSQTAWISKYELNMNIFVSFYVVMMRKGEDEGIIRYKTAKNGHATMMRYKTAGAKNYRARMGHHAVI